MTVYLMISLPKIPYIHRIYMVLANLNHVGKLHGEPGLAGTCRVGGAQKRKNCFAGSDGTASLSKGGGYVVARSRQPPPAQTYERKNSVGQGGCVPWHPDLHLDCCCLGCTAVHILF